MQKQSYFPDVMVYSPNYSNGSYTGILRLERCSIKK